ncbi:MAG: hypothetical protein F6K16_30965 [Symploca sp. SIO2B6]|nr:hypothetical protein [Symploca sp. SIO2B6]
MRNKRITNFLIWVPITLAVWASAYVNLPLFQDGAAYLLQLVQTESVAVMHKRFSAFLFQFPTVIIVQGFTSVLSPIPRKMEFIRFSFSFSYALIPFISFILSWLAIRRRDRAKRLLIWPALIILFINLVNFSWVSEILIALQLSCPLLLVSIIRPSTRKSWYLRLPLLIVVLLLHPLVIVIFSTFVLGMLYLAYQHPHQRKDYLHNAALFLGSAILRLLLSVGRMSTYEESFIEPHNMKHYLFTTTFENQLFLAIALILASLCLFARAIAPTSQKLTYLYRLGMCLAVLGPCILVSQYQYADFQLKTGLSILLSLVLFLMVCIDSTFTLEQDSAATLLHEKGLRLNVITVLAVMFSLVILVKSLIWQTAVQKLQQTLATTPHGCLELVADELSWRYQPGHKIINTWAITSLALLEQDHAPRTVLLEQDCQTYWDTGQVTIQPWGTFPKEMVIPAL